MNDTKRCSKCREFKALNEFNKDRQKADGLCAWCKTCRNVDKCSYYQKNSTKIKRKVEEWREANPKRKVDSYRNSRYTLQPNQFDELLARQGGKCAVCTRSFTDRLKPNVDHDHRCCPPNESCGKCVRGLLCAACNKALGYLRDDLESLRNAIIYLQGVNE